MAELGNIDTYKINNTTIHLAQGDITKLHSKLGITVDAIVNAANTELARGSGVCGAIFQAAQGTEKRDYLTEQIQAYFPHGINPGEAVITKSYALASQGVQAIIHAVGPIYARYRDKNEAANVLKNAYISSMDVAAFNNLISIAFPFISSAIYGYPKPEAASIALNAIMEYAQKYPQSKIHDVYFVLFYETDLNIFKNELSNIIKAKFQFNK